MTLYKWRRRKKLFDLLLECELRVCPLYRRKDLEDLPACDILEASLNRLYEQLKQTRLTIIKSGLKSSEFCPKSKALADLIHLVESVAGPD